eukprot:TRINITY_DN31210_c0_g2_i1.p1 TRINITY_DN31210_c0_g2~~TRINITY_DN31210_c0_g2_i1.p1  ORF type:complete len:399 (+),score=95.91 TRINITY_DN31210_c0_g2_i1:91-1197(+)
MAPASDDAEVEKTGTTNAAAAAVELLCSVSKEVSSITSVYEDLGSEAPQKCRPNDLGDFHERLNSFWTAWWFNKPIGLSPIDAARRGWVNSGYDTLTCRCCGGELKVERNESGAWLANGEPLALGSAGSSKPTAASCRAALENGHSAFCPWRSSAVRLNDPASLSDAELASGVESRRQNLAASLENQMPTVAEGSGKAADPALTLALAGWDVASKGENPTMRCFLCLRTVPVKEHDKIPTYGDSVSKIGRAADGEPPAKAARQAPAATADTLFDPFSFFDPYARHRFYCPLFCRPDEELGPVAVRLVKAREAAAAAAESSKTSTQDDEKDASKATSAIATADAAAVRAEALLRALDAILPAVEETPKA